MNAERTLVGWLRARGLLRGPHVFVDYWASVLRLHGVVPERLTDTGLVDRPLFRLGLDRPDLIIPRLRGYLALFLVGPLLFPFRAFRRLGRYRIRYRREADEGVLPALADYRLEVEPRTDGTVRVSKGGRVLAERVIDPYRAAGFSSLFFAAYKLPLASLAAIVLVAVVAPLVHATPFPAAGRTEWLFIIVPLLMLLLYALFRDWPTAFLGALPVLIGRILLGVLRPSGAEDWAVFFSALGALFLIYVLADWFFMPRPVPPALFLYAADGPGAAYERAGDAPYWLEGTRYWVWRYMILSPAELSKFWERDWERIELWIRADGDEAGNLEWVVTDSHYRELWIPFDRLGSAAHLARQKAAAGHALKTGRQGFWLVEADANLVFHTPFLRTVSFLVEGGGAPTRSVGHLLRSMWKQPKEREIGDYLRRLHRLRFEQGLDLLKDVPELVERLAARHMLSQPWRYWRYPLGAATRREHRLYEHEATGEPPLAADPDLQIKEDRR